jgi:hypothetical protein
VSDVTPIVTVVEQSGNTPVTRHRHGEHARSHEGEGERVGAEDDPAPVVGLTGARFGGAQRRPARTRAGTRSDDDETSRLPMVPAEDPVAGRPERCEPDQPVVGLTGARFGGARRRPKSTASRPPAPAESAAPSVPSVAPAEPVADEDEPAAASVFVRPYVFTGGRTRAQFELSLEALVSVAPRVASHGLGAEHDAVMELCREPRSVAEVAALLAVPLGVARVLLGDLAAAGVVAVHRTADAGGPDLALMERVLAGLRRL